MKKTTKLTKISTHTKCTVDTMSKECFKWLDNYISGYDVQGSTIEETKSNIMKLTSFRTGCMTYIQAQAYAEYLHKSEVK